MTVSDYIMSFLVARGVDTAFCLTGWGALGLDDSMAKIMNRYVCARNEAAAPIMAKGWSKLTGKMGLVVVTAGPGGANAASATVECWVDSVPIMILNGQVPAKEVYPNARTFGTAGFDILSMVKSITKFSARMTNVSEVKSMLETAYHLATIGRPGPVWLDVPLDLQTMPYGPAQ